MTRNKIEGKKINNWLVISFLGKRLMDNGKLIKSRTVRIEKKIKLDEVNIWLS